MDDRFSKAVLLCNQWHEQLERSREETRRKRVDMPSEIREKVYKVTSETVIAYADMCKTRDEGVVVASLDFNLHLFFAAVAFLTLFVWGCLNLPRDEVQSIRAVLWYALRSCEEVYEVMWMQVFPDTIVPPHPNFEIDSFGTFCMWLAFIGPLCAGRLLFAIVLVLILAKVCGIAGWGAYIVRPMAEWFLILCILKTEDDLPDRERERELVMRCLPAGGKFVHLASVRLQHNEEFLLNAVETNSEVLAHTGGRFMRDNKFVLKAIARNHRAVKHIPADFFRADNQDLVLQAVALHSYTFYRACSVMEEEARRSESFAKFMQAALEKNVHTIQYWPIFEHAQPKLSPLEVEGMFDQQVEQGVFDPAYQANGAHQPVFGWLHECKLCVFRVAPVPPLAGRPCMVVVEYDVAKWGDIKKRAVHKLKLPSGPGAYGLLLLREAIKEDELVPWMEGPQPVVYMLDLIFHKPDDSVR